MTELIDVDDLYEPYRLARAKVREALALLEGPEKDPDVLHAELRETLRDVLAQTSAWKGDNRWLKST